MVDRKFLLDRQRMKKQVRRIGVYRDLVEVARSSLGRASEVEFIFRYDGKERPRLNENLKNYYSTIDSLTKAYRVVHPKLY
jgi:hypothetical protein